MGEGTVSDRYGRVQITIIVGLGPAQAGDGIVIAGIEPVLQGIDDRVHRIGLIRMFVCQEGQF